MRFRGRQEITERDEQSAADDLRSSLERKGGYDPARPPDAFWSNMLIEVNRKLDDATSGKALSLSWAARVAIPGVVAIISFYIGLHYYVPGPVRNETAVAPIIGSLPQSDIDSLFAEQPLGDAAESIHEAVFTINGDDAAQYLLSSGETSSMIEALPEGQLDELLTKLSEGKNL